MIESLLPPPILARFANPIKTITYLPSSYDFGMILKTLSKLTIRPRSIKTPIIYKFPVLL